MKGCSSCGTDRAALAMALSRGRASFAGSLSGCAITGDLGAAAPSAGTLGEASAAGMAAAGGASGSCSAQGVLPVVAIAPAESVTCAVKEKVPSVVGMPLIAPLDGLRSEEHTSELQSLRHLVCR